MPVSDRRGSALWKAIGPTGNAAIKAGTGEGALITGREAAVMAAMAHPGLTASGRSDGAAWLVKRWLNGPSVWDVFRPVRDTGQGHTEAHAAAVELCRTVADLHASGWVHADIQAAHGIHTPRGVRLIDLSWAHGPGGPPPSGLFRGGLPHLLAPELAASITRGERPVQPSADAEVYALAGTLWRCATGTWPLDYTAAGIDPHRMTPDVLRSVIARGTIRLTTRAPWPGLQHVLREVLLSKPSDRPTAGELAGLMAKAAA